MNSIMPSITVDIWFDYICPWCWIAKKRFDKALSELEYSEHVSVHHHSYRIGIDSPEVPFKSALRDKLGGENAAELMMSQIESHANLEGLTYNFDTMSFGDTLDAHILSAAARNMDLGEQMSEKLFFSSTTEGRTIFDRNMLRTLAKEIGMTAEHVEAAFDDPIVFNTVYDDEERAQAIGVSSVPLFVINDKFIISGAQPSNIFLTSLRKAWEEKEDIHILKDGNFCGLNGCE